MFVENCRCIFKLLAKISTSKITPCQIIIENIDDCKVALYNVLVTCVS